jgi:hypothetical protein
MVKAAALVVAISIVVVTASEAQQKSTIEAKLNEIGDITIIAVADKLVAEAQNALSDISKDVEAKQRASEFKTIRSLRLRLNKKSLELRALLESFRQYKLSLTSQVSQKQNAIQTGPSNKLQAELMGIELDRLKQRIDSAKAELEETKKLAETAEGAARQARARDVAQQELAVKENEAEFRVLEERRAQLSNPSTTTQQEIDDLNSIVQKIDSAVLSRAQSSLRNLDETLVEIDEQSNALLQTDILSINYTDRSTYIFAILVGAVIIVFLE